MVLHLVVRLMVNVHKTTFSQVYMQEVPFHEFIYFDQYIVCFFNEILSTVCEAIYYIINMQKKQ